MALFTSSTDPGHGWLLVTPVELEAVGLSEADISPFSYRTADMLALEEDCDAAVFLHRWKLLHPQDAPTFKELHHDPNPIRNWRGFGRATPERIKALMEEVSQGAAA